VHHIAHSGGLDEQDAREIRLANIGSGQGNGKIAAREEPGKASARCSTGARVPGTAFRCQ
jgi:hypothetical protein